mgnify:FL=1
MGLKMSPGSVIAELDAKNTGMNQIIDNAKKVLFEISTLEESSDRLQGESYNSIREYYTTLHVAVMHQTIIFAEAVIQENNAYKACICGELGGIGYVDEDALERDKECIEEQINRVYELMNAVKGCSYSALLGSLENALHLVEKKLRQIESFLGASSGLYQNIGSYQADLKRGIECLHSSVFDGSRINYQVNHADLSWVNRIEKDWVKRNLELEKAFKETFLKNMEEQFGFDRRTGEILFRLYNSMEKSDAKDVNLEYFKLLASFVYTYEEVGYDESVLWQIFNFGAGPMINAEEFKEPLTKLEKEKKLTLNDMWHFLVRTYSRDGLENELKGYGLTEEDISYLEEGINDNYKYTSDDSQENQIKYKQYFGKIDLAHMAIVMTAILTPDNNAFLKAGDGSGIFNGIYDLRANAGYVGDVYGTAGNGPKLTPDDYKADLDAVNLSTRFQNGGNAIEIMNQYYSEITDATGNRAKEFATNIGHGNYKEGIKILKEQAHRHNVYILEHMGAEFLLDRIKESPAGITIIKDKLDDLYVPTEVWEERGKIVRNFIHSIESNRNEYETYETVDIDFAENGEHKNE